MNSDSMEEIAKNGTAEDVRNLLKSSGGDTWNGKDDRGSRFCIDTILYASTQDKDEARKAQKIALVAAYSAKGKKGLRMKFKTKAAERPELETLKQLAFSGASENVVELLKAQANDEAAIRAIIEGAQQDHKRFLRRQSADDRMRRSEKKDIVAEFYAKSGRFAPVEEPAGTQAQITQLQTQLAEMEKTVAKQRSATPVTLKLQQH